MIESLSFGTPVVASDVGGISDIVIDGVTGLLVPEMSVVALAAAVVRILKEPVLAGRLAENGLKHVRDYFGWSGITDRIEAVYCNARAAPGIPFA